MILLVDIGNSRVKWAVSDGRVLRTPEAAEHAGKPAEVLKARTFPRVDQALVAHVMGPEQEGGIAAAIGAACGVAPRFARTEAHHKGLSVAYAEPQRLGVDRWLAMLALWAERRTAFGVVNAGTALTYDAVDAGGRHLGGLIAPGLMAAQQAVRGTTRFEIRPQPARYDEGLGADTESCVRQGALHACAGLVERMGRSAPGTRFITGGDAETLLRHVSRAHAIGAGQEWHWRPHLVMEGLLAYARSH